MPLSLYLSYLSQKSLTAELEKRLRWVTYLSLSKLLLSPISHSSKSLKWVLTEYHLPFSLIPFWIKIYFAHLHQCKCLHLPLQWKTPSISHRLQQYKILQQHGWWMHCRWLWFHPQKISWILFFFTFLQAVTKFYNFIYLQSSAQTKIESVAIQEWRGTQWQSRR